MKFSLLLSVYQGDEKDWLKLAFQSITNQTHLPDEIILVEDGKIPRDLKEIIRTFEKNKKKIPLKVISLKQNQGLATALNKGIAACKYEWIARFDADDINLPDRFQKQADFL